MGFAILHTSTRATPQEHRSLPFGGVIEKRVRHDKCSLIVNRKGPTMTTMTKHLPATRSSKTLNIPETMRAAAIDRFGGPEVLSIHELPTPVAEPKEVLIALDTAGVGVWDAEMRAGWL